MFDKSSKYELVLLESPYRNWENPLTQEFFVKMVSLKRIGYQASYPANVLAIDASDYVADHLLICRRDQVRGLVPVSGVKSITYELSEYFHVDFVPEKLMKSSDATKPHLEALYEILERAESFGKKVGYYSSWTIEPGLRGKREVTSEIKDIFTAITVLYHEAYQVPELLGLGAVKFKADQLFYQWGYEAVEFGGKRLPNIFLERYEDAEVVFLHLKEFSLAAKELAAKYKSLWENRLVIGKPIAPARVA